jgi:methylmalonyl-CoA mutase cobalamin-binding subunit
MPEDKFTVTVQDDGTIKVETDAIGMANHANAEEFMRFLARAMGGEVIRTKTGQTHSHAHEREHLHQ